MITPFSIPPEELLRLGGRRSPRSPYRQGDLDGLCGVYAVINALRLVCPELTSRQCERLFKRLIRRLRGRKRGPLDAVTSGMGLRTLGDLLATAQGYVEARLGVTVTARKLPRRVLAVRRADLLLRELGELLTPPERVAIIGIGGAMAHWTVATRVGPKHLHLFDSGKRKRFARAKCSVREAEGRYALKPGDVLIVERRNG